VIPKTPSIDATETDSEVLAHMMILGQKIAKAQRSILGATGNNFIFNCGADGGQEVFHTHMHVVPRHKNDGVYKKPTHTKYADGEAVQVAAKLTEVL
jgi:histidine triad (HIT) family protein